MSYAYLPEFVIATWASLSLPAKAVCVSIASFMNVAATGCWPSIPTLRDHAGLKDKRTVKKALAELGEAGVIKMEFRDGQSYRFSWAQPPSSGVGGTSHVPGTSHVGGDTATPYIPCTPPPTSHAGPPTSHVPRRILEKDTRKNNNRGPTPSTAAAAEELAGLDLYEADAALCRAWPQLYPSWQRAYPHLDITAEVAKAHAWEMANPAKRKTDRPRFLTNWLARVRPSDQNVAPGVDESEEAFLKASLAYRDSGIEEMISGEEKDQCA